MPRLVVALVIAVALAACTDVRDYAGFWTGERIGEPGPLRVGGSDAAAVLRIDGLDKHQIAASLTIEGLFESASLTSMQGAGRDVLGSLTFDGAPERVYLAWVSPIDDGGPILAVLSLHDERVELRLLRAGDQPIYAVFALHRS